MPPSPDPAQPDSRLPFRGGLVARTTTRAQHQRRVAFDSTHEKDVPKLFGRSPGHLAAPASASALPCGPDRQTK